ncbi:MAG: protein translocase subunit SecF [bacterium]|nr:protein translocase subunit SecF [bacterium]
MNIVGSRKISYSISGALVAIALLTLLVFGLNLGTDFTGDASLQGNYKEDISSESLTTRLDESGLPVIDVEIVGRDIVIRSGYLDVDNHKALIAVLGEEGEFEQKSFVSTGPTISHQLRKNAFLAIGIALLVIILYIAFAFRKVSKPVSSWVYGLIAIVALIHDVVIPTGIFAALGIEIDSLFVSALLTVLGFSVHDTIVVFDRVRENLKKSKGSGSFDDIVEVSLKETIVRSINTSITTLFVLGTIYFLGGEATKNFALALILGVALGTYSSIFIASPLLVTVERWRVKRSS